MRFIGLFLVNILTGLPLAAPNPTIHDRGKVIQRKESVPTLHVTNLNVFVSNNSVVPSHISFHVVDPRPEQYGETDCVFSTNATYKSIYLSGWWDCDRNFDISFWLREDTLSLRRPWIQDPAEPYVWDVVKGIRTTNCGSVNSSVLLTTSGWTGT